MEYLKKILAISVLVPNDTPVICNCYNVAVILKEVVIVKDKNKPCTRSSVRKCEIIEENAEY